MRSRMRESASTDLREPQGSNPLGPPGPDLRVKRALNDDNASCESRSQHRRSVVGQEGPARDWPPPNLWVILASGPRFSTPKGSIRKDEAGYVGNPTRRQSPSRGRVEPLPRGTVVFGGPR